jgi:hypothetical protein
LSVNSETENNVGRPKKAPKKRGFPPKPVDMVPVKDIERLKREIRQEARYELEEERYKKKQEQRELVREAARIAYIDRRVQQP